MKIGIVGAGAVGSACLLSLVARGTGSEIVVINRHHARAEGVVTDLQYGATLWPGVALRAGEPEDLANASLVIITAGANEKTGGATDRSDPAGRLRLFEHNAGVYQDIVPKVVQAAPEAIILVVTDPPDPLADLTRRLAGHDRVLSTGTYLDSLRFRFHLARALAVAPHSIEAQVLGEHGTSQVFVWSSARVAGTPVLALLRELGEDVDEVRKRIEEEVRYANIAIIEGTGASQLGIGVVVARIAEVIMRNEHAALPIGSYHPRHGVTLSLPAIVGRRGVERVLNPEMSQDERDALERSAEALRHAMRSMGTP